MLFLFFLFHQDFPSSLSLSLSQNIIVPDQINSYIYTLADTHLFTYYCPDLSTSTVVTLFPSLPILAVLVCPTFVSRPEVSSLVLSVPVPVLRFSSFSTQSLFPPRLSFSCDSPTAFLACKVRIPFDFFDYRQ
ncbi:hypothetical protein CC2G_002316 [Coprinopsis cinerea AmutBmut pab1-1]|nr:hypothetical protein CC2G_002316 [Coprinopsis cinerea AmutBmut pab1-1]